MTERVQSTRRATLGWSANSTKLDRGSLTGSFTRRVFTPAKRQTQSERTTMTSEHRDEPEASASAESLGGEEPAGKAEIRTGTEPEERPAGVEPEAGFPIVGIGASAGGLAAFETFFSAMPGDADPGMAFVLVQHLAPDHTSILPELIRRCTKMEVFEVEDGMQLRPNCAYVIPPNHNLALMNGALHLLEFSSARAPRLPIDFFFQSLSQDLHERAIGIVLSGTGSDGTVGIRAIKAEGGMVIAQSLASAEFDGMPRSALATGLVDYELTPAEMPTQLIAYVAHAFGTLVSAGSTAPHERNALQRIFVLLRQQTGHDVSEYKSKTITRRIARRMVVHHIDNLDNYVKYLQQTPLEVKALFDDLLIGVTRFFRDPDAFQVLEEMAIPALFVGKPSGANVRVWSPGCSTGEEAYSIAMLLAERMEAIRCSYSVQLFATDIDARAIATARAGLYPASIAADVSPDRLARFFKVEPDGNAYRIHKGIRDMVIFSEQDLIRDPPFTRLDLISCRNLLIYLGGDLQKKLIPMFQYALNQSGLLFLGTSEGIGDFGELFLTLDRKAKLYRSNPDSPGMRRSPMGPSLARHTEFSGAFPRIPVAEPLGTRTSLREVTEQAALRYLAPTCALVSGNGDILYVHGRTGMYLEQASGEAGVSNVLTMAREGLRRELTAALRQAVTTKTVAHASGLRVKTNGHFTMANVSVQLVPSTGRPPVDVPLFLVMFEEAPSVESEPTRSAAGAGGPAGAAALVETGADGDVDLRVATLQQELRAKEDYLQSANEELETTNEELKCSNEEMQSVNEELQSTNEELETSREEMQSINEELATVNAELQTKVVDWTRANNDLQNMLVGTGIATIFVDHQQRILRFTPSMGRLINLLPADTGRPVGDLVPKLRGYDRLVPDVQAVLDTLVPREVEVETTDGAWFLMRIQPYRTLDNVIEGAVLSFVDHTETWRARETLRKANDMLRLAVVVRDAHDAITVQDLDGRILAWNPGAVRMYGWTEVEALQLNVRDRIPEALRVDAVAKLHQLSQSGVLEPYQTQRLTKAGATVSVSIISTALMSEAGRMYAIATTERVSSVKKGE